MGVESTPNSNNPNPNPNQVPPKLLEVYYDNIRTHKISGVGDSDQTDGMSPEVASDIGVAVGPDELKQQIASAQKVAKLMSGTSRGDVSENTDSDLAQAQTEGPAVNRFFDERVGRSAGVFEMPRRGRSNWVNENERRSSEYERRNPMTPEQQAEQLERNRRGVEEVRRILREDPSSGQ